MHTAPRKHLAVQIGLIAALTAGYQAPTLAQTGFALEEVILARFCFRSCTCSSSGQGSSSDE